MKIEFVAQIPDAADVVAFVVTKASFADFAYQVDSPQQLLETA